LGQDQNKRNKKIILIIFIFLILAESFTILNFISIKMMDVSHDFMKVADIKTNWKNYTLILLDMTFYMGHIYYEDDIPNYPWAPIFWYENYGVYAISNNIGGLILVNQNNELILEESNFIRDSIIEKKLIKIVIFDLFLMVKYPILLLIICFFVIKKKLGNKWYKFIIISISSFIILIATYSGYEQLFLYVKIIFLILF